MSVQSPLGETGDADFLISFARLPSRKALSIPSSRTDGTGPSGPQLGVSRPQGEGKHVQYIGEAGDIVVMHRQVLTRLAAEDSL